MLFRTSTNSYGLDHVAFWHRSFHYCFETSLITQVCPRSDFKIVNRKSSASQIPKWRLCFGHSLFWVFLVLWTSRDCRTLVWVMFLKLQSLQQYVICLYDSATHLLSNRVSIKFRLLHLNWKVQFLLKCFKILCKKDAGSGTIRVQRMK